MLTEFYRTWPHTILKVSNRAKVNYWAGWTVINADSISGLSAVSAHTYTPYFLPVIRKNSSYVAEQCKKFCGSQNKPTFSSKVISNTYIALYKNLETGSQKGWQGHFFLSGHITDRRTTWKKKALTKAGRNRGLLCERLNKALKKKRKQEKIPLQTYNPKETNIREQGNLMRTSFSYIVHLGYS